VTICVHVLNVLFQGVVRGQKFACRNGGLAPSSGWVKAQKFENDNFLINRLSTMRF
jgi:hypothetical protein